MIFDSLLILVFCLGYLFIAFEHKVHINKAAVALLMAVVCWAVNFIEIFPNNEIINHHLNEHLGEVSQVVLFLIGSMVVVELIDAYKGFDVITHFVQTRDKRKLLWIISFISYFLSALLANMTVAVVMISLLRRLLPASQERKILVCLVIVASNAGGAWTPIGDTTTMMLWIGGQVSTFNIMKLVFIPSLVSLLVPLIYFSIFMKKEECSPTLSQETALPIKGSRQVFFLGIGTMLFVPFLSTFTNLPAYMGMLLSLSIMWILTDLIHQEGHF